MAKKKAPAKKRKTLKRRFNLKTAGIPLKALIKGLDLVIKSKDDPDDAVALKGVLQPIVKQLKAECGALRWSVSV